MSYLRLSDYAMLHKNCHNVLLWTQTGNGCAVNPVKMLIKVTKFPLNLKFGQQHLERSQKLLADWLSVKPIY